jgi:hypothetical protein
VNKARAWKAWQRIGPGPGLLDAILAAVRRQRASPQWQDPQYVPGPANWLRDRRWEDEVAAAGGNEFDRAAERLCPGRKLTAAEEKLLGLNHTEDTHDADG